MLAKKLLILSSVWVEPNSSAAGARMLQLIALFQAQDYQVTYASTANESANAVDLEYKAISTKQILLNDSSFDEFIQELQPDIVLFDRFMLEEQFGWRIADYCPNALRVLDTEDLHCLRKGRELALKNNSIFQEEDLLTLPIAKREIASILRCDLSLIISKYEMQLLINTFHISEKLLHYLPFLVNPIDTDTINDLPIYEQRKDFYFVGNFLHKPNYDAILQLKNTIWPLLKVKLPKAKLHVYGAYASDKVMQLHNEKQGFLVHGCAENLVEIIENSRVCLAPLRFGAGLKGKLLEAMRYGAPSATTQIGAEAMTFDLPWSGIIADDITNFVTKTATLYTNKEMWLEAQENGFKIYNTIYNKANYEDEFVTIIKQLIANLTRHRKNNFLGNILLEEQYRSSKFMALWIAAKNKKD